MKEVTYGWYPPARDILASYPGKQPGNSYTKECLFKHSQSRYADKPGVKTPQDPLDSMQWRASPQQIRKYKSIRRSPSPKRSSRVQSSASSMINLEIRGHSQTKAATEVRPTSAQSATESVTRPASASSDVKVFVPAKTYVTQSQKVTREPSVRPGKAWSVSSTDNNIADLRQFLRDSSRQGFVPHPPSPAPSNHSSRCSLPGQWAARSGTATPPHPPSAGNRLSADRKERVKSATTYRQRIDVPRRSVMSAGPARFGAESPAPTLEPLLNPEDQSQEVDQPREEDRDVEELLDPELFYPDHVDVDTESVTKAPLDPGKEELGVDEPLDYNQQLKKYGWRMQVHGDPLNLKRSCIAKRYSFTTKLPKPQIPPDPYKVRKENVETFFLNTIPRKPMSFTIHQEWASEVLHAKRMELQKRDGDTYKYRHTDYAFIY